MKEAELAAILNALRASHGNIRQAAKVLGIARSSLYRKLHEFQLSRT